MIDKEKRLQVPLHHLGGIVCIGRVNLSNALMARCMEDVRIPRQRDRRFQTNVTAHSNGS